MLTCPIGGWRADPGLGRGPPVGVEWEPEGICGWEDAMRTSAVHEPLVVSTDGTAGPYITVTPDQLEPVLQALRAHEVPVEVDEDAVLLGGMPALSLIN